MRICPIQSAMLALAACAASPAFAADEYPLPMLAGAAAYSETTSYQREWDGSWDGEGEIIYMDDLDEGEEWHSGERGERRIRTVIRHDVAPEHGPPHAMPPGRPGEHPLAYGEAERAAWLAECRARISQTRDYSDDTCGDYLARYEAGLGGGDGYDHSYGYAEHASYGCGSCGCNSGCGCSGGCGCSVSYRFAPIPAPVVQVREKTIRRTITTEEWVEELPGRTVQVITTPVKTVPVKTVPVKAVPVKQAPAKPQPVKQAKPVYAK